MSILCRLIFIAGLFSINLMSAVIAFEVSEVGVTAAGDTLYRYTYSPEGFTLPQNSEIDIRFDPALYGELSNGVAPAEFDLLLLQPNNPPGAFGDYSALALIDNPPLSGVFSVDFTFLGAGVPGAQPWLVNQFDEQGNFVSTIASGTTASSTAVVPEPATCAAGCFTLLMAGAAHFWRRRTKPQL